MPAFRSCLPPCSPLLQEGLGHALLMLAAGFLLTGCGGTEVQETPLHEPPGSAFRQAAGTRDEALALLDSLKRGALRGAFRNLERFDYRRHVRTEQRSLGEEGRVIAFEERTVRHMPGGAGERATRVLQRDSSGTFDLGLLGRFASARPGTPAPDLARQILSEEPAFLSARNRYAFQYRLLPDTTLPGGLGRTRVVAIRARPGPDGQKQTTRRARLYLDARTGQLVALRLHRAHQAMLFDEDTRLSVRLRRSPSDSAAWVPAQTRFATQLDMPLRPARRFRSTASYDEYRTAPS